MDELGCGSVSRWVDEVWVSRGVSWMRRKWIVGESEGAYAICLEDEARMSKTNMSRGEYRG